MNNIDIPQNIKSKDIMEIEILDCQKVSKIAIQILKSKEQWVQNQSQVSVSSFYIQKCQVYLVQVNFISSTMLLSQNWPKELLKNKINPVILAFRADLQKFGRGQKLNSWNSPEGNLHLTLLFSIQFFYFPYLPLISANNVYRVIKQHLDQSKVQAITKIKWTNDILIDFEKVSGILIKSQMLGQALFTQIGIGVNIKKAPQNIHQIKQSVTYMEKHMKSDVSIRQFSMKMIKQFVESFYIHDFNTIKSSAKQDYQTNLAYLNKQVVIYDYKYQKILGQGIFKGINEYGHAILNNYENAFIEGRMKNALIL